MSQTCDNSIYNVLQVLQPLLLYFQSNSLDGASARDKCTGECWQYPYLHQSANIW